MSLFTREPELKELILTALKQIAIELESEYNNKEIYSFVIYPSSGFRDLGIAYCTRSYQKNAVRSVEPLDPDILKILNNHPELLEQASNPSENYFEITACEWDGVRAYSDMFSEINDLINEEYDALYDAGIENSEICQFFENLLTEVLLQMKSAKIFSSSAFEDDLLLGVQIPDTEDTEMVIRVSKAVNSSAWHEKICDGYESNRE